MQAWILCELLLPLHTSVSNEVFGTSQTSDEAQQISKCCISTWVVNTVCYLCAGDKQAEQVVALLKRPEHAFVDVHIKQDLSGVKRFVVALKRESVTM